MCARSRLAPPALPAPRPCRVYLPLRFFHSHHHPRPSRTANTHNTRPLHPNQQPAHIQKAGWIRLADSVARKTELFNATTDPTPNLSSGNSLTPHSPHTRAASASPGSVHMRGHGKHASTAGPWRNMRAGASGCCPCGASSLRLRGTSRTGRRPTFYRVRCRYTPAGWRGRWRCWDGAQRGGCGGAAADGARGGEPVGTGGAACDAGILHAWCPSVQLWQHEQLVPVDACSQIINKNSFRFG
ncbi:hypothetical protein K438DRAFT_1892167 [Mycena galopus ATCC 62051]|nr:hypothetical protein K438DRAFT_1892167 [Mycena galopus ATCC 62051]